MKNFFIPLINSFVLTACFLAGLIAFQADIANFFGMSSVAQPKFSLFKELILPIFSAFGGAVSGAYIAFKLQTKKEEKLSKERNLSYINRTLFSLHMQMTDLLNIKEQIFLPQEKNPIRFLQILPMANDDHLSEKISMDFAQVLIDSNKPQLVQEILIAEKKYFNLMRLLQTRNKIKNEIDQKMVGHGVGHATSYRLDEILQILGPQLIAQSYDATEKFIEMLDETGPYFHKKINDLIEESGKIFKGFEGNRVGLIADEHLKQLLQPLAKPKFETKEKLFEVLETDWKNIIAENKGI